MQDILPAHFHHIKRFNLNVVKYARSRLNLLFFNHLSSQMGLCVGSRLLGKTYTVRETSVRKLHPNF